MNEALFFPVFFTTVFLSFVFTVLLTARLLTRLQKKKIGQTILVIGPKWHKSKEGTPTMGGIAFLCAFLPLCIFFAVWLSRRDTAFHVLPFILTVLYILLNGAVGLFDDLTKHLHRRNEGLSAKAKFALQALCAALYLLALARFSALDTALPLPFLHTKVELGLWFYPFAFFFLVGVVNSVNLTDGIDGLAGAVTMAVGGFLCVLCVRTSHTQGLFLSACTVGICIAFLLFNAHPARIFMGDTGSLFLGASVAGIALYTGQILPVCIGGIFYLIEAASVILQVGYFKLTGRRLFKMAPFHHHLEQCGYTEGKIVFLAVGLTLTFCVLAFFGVQ